jgi:NADP-dependent 3-hydroxy acid dehydrogenase YdfG
MRLDKKVALITGGYGGMGRASTLTRLLFESSLRTRLSGR